MAIKYNGWLCGSLTDLQAKTIITEKIQGSTIGRKDNAISVLWCQGVIFYRYGLC